MKYRIPNINEFKKGFKYEVYSEGYHDGDLEDLCGFYKYSFQEGFCFRDIDDIQRDLNNNAIRVLIE